MCQATLPSVSELNGTDAKTLKEDVLSMDIFWYYINVTWWVLSLPEPLFSLVIIISDTMFEWITKAILLITKTKYIYTRKYPFSYPQELLLLSYYMMNTWFSKFICSMGGINFEERISILTQPKEVMINKVKKPPGNPKKKKTEFVNKNKLSKKENKRTKRLNNTRKCPLIIHLPSTFLHQCHSAHLQKVKWPGTSF